MSDKLEIFRKQAKLLVRWHREGNFSIGGRMRKLPHLAAMTDSEALAHPFTLAEAQAVIALEEGFPDWATLKRKCQERGPQGMDRTAPALRLSAALPVLFVADVQRAAAFYRDSLGFSVDFLHGHPPFYGGVSRDSARLHLKWVRNAAEGRIQAEGLIMAFVQVENVKALYGEFLERSVALRQPLTRQAWGGSDFHVGDLDGNVIAFVG